jgi:dephospho-CoA kinase
MRAGSAETDRISQIFGNAVIAADGSVNRRRLASVVFPDPSRLRALEAIVHPGVRDAIRERLARFQGSRGIIVVDAVRLLQSDLLSLVKEVWVVECLPDVQERRLTETREMSLSEARDRINAQPTFEHPRVSRVIPNSGSHDELRREVEAAWGSFVEAD